MFEHRSACFSDLPELSKLCLATALNGQDASNVTHQSELLTDLYVKPYLVGPNTESLIALKNGQAIGYLVGSWHTGQFSQWFNQSYLPTLRNKTRNIHSTQHEFDEALLQKTNEYWQPPSTDYDSYGFFHISMSEKNQRQKYGKALIYEFALRLKSKGTKTIWIEVSHQNTKANPFFEHIGFEQTHHQSYANVMTCPTDALLYLIP